MFIFVYPFICQYFGLVVEKPQPIDMAQQILANDPFLKTGTFETPNSILVHSIKIILFCVYLVGHVWLVPLSPEHQPNLPSLTVENAITHSFKYVNDISLADVHPANLPSNIDADVQDLDV